MIYAAIDGRVAPLAEVMPGITPPPAHRPHVMSDESQLHSTAPHSSQYLPYPSQLGHSRDEFMAFFRGYATLESFER